MGIKKALERIDYHQNMTRNLSKHDAFMLADLLEAYAEEDEPAREIDGSFCKYCGPMNCVCDGYGNDRPPKEEKTSTMKLVDVGELQKVYEQYKHPQYYNDCSSDERNMLNAIKHVLGKH